MNFNLNKEITFTLIAFSLILGLYHLIIFFNNNTDECIKFLIQFLFSVVYINLCFLISKLIVKISNFLESIISGIIYWHVNKPRFKL